MMRILVIEDEQVIAARLIRIVDAVLRSHPHTIHHIDDLYDGLDYLRKHPIDLLFLDLNLNGSDGFQVLLEAAAGSFQTIIVSAHADQAIQAFEYGVTDFVAKPYTEERLKKAINRVLENKPAQNNQTKFLAVRTQGRIRALTLSEIVYIRGADDYSEIHCTDGASYLHDRTLQELDSLLPHSFERIHRSFIVNFDFVEGCENLPGSQYKAVLKNGETLPVSRKRIQEFRRRLMS